MYITKNNTNVTQLLQQLRFFVPADNTSHDDCVFWGHLRILYNPSSSCTEIPYAVNETRKKQDKLNKRNYNKIHTETVRMGTSDKDTSVSIIKRIIIKMHKPHLEVDTTHSVPMQGRKTNEIVFREDVSPLSIDQKLELHN